MLYWAPAQTRIASHPPPPPPRPHLSQCLHQARVFSDTDFEEVCEEHHIADKLQSLEIMCAEQGIVDGVPSDT